MNDFHTSLYVLQASLALGQSMMSIAMSGPAEAAPPAEVAPSVPAGHIFPVMTADEVAAVSVRYADMASRLRAVLDEHGVAIIPDMLPPEEVARIEALWSADLREVLDDPEGALAAARSAAAEEAAATAAGRATEGTGRFAHLAEALERSIAAAAADGKSDNLARVWPPGTELGASGFALDVGLPHGRAAWAARLQPRLKAAYALLHDCEPSDLAVGCDVIFFTPHGSPERESSASVWPHADVNVHAGAPAVYQSALYVWPSAGRDGASTTVVWPGSHRGPYKRLMADPAFVALGRLGLHYCTVKGMADKAASAALLDEFLAGARRVPVPAGGCLIWASSTMHQGHAGGPRLAFPVCWEPRERRSEETLRRKARLAWSGLPSTHWASLGIPHDLAQQVQTARPAAPPAPGDDWRGARLPLKALIAPPVDTALLDGSSGAAATTAAALGTLPGEAAELRARVLADGEGYYLSIDADEAVGAAMLRLLRADIAEAL